jgi:hypothetical protein
MAQTFEAPRAMLSFSARGHEFAVDLRDGNTPERVRGFFEQILKLRRDPDLAEELIKTRLQAISPVLLADGDAQEKDAARSIFFFLGPEAVLSRAARQLAIDMVEMWPSDYWVN